MSELSFGDKIFKLVQSLERNKNKPDLHSFVGQTRSGAIFVEFRNGEIYMDETRDGKTHLQWAGTCIAGANRLEMLGLDLNSVEI